MDGKAIALVAVLLLGSGMLGAVAFMDLDSNDADSESKEIMKEDPLIQGEDHDHRDPTHHNLSLIHI